MKKVLLFVFLSAISSGAFAIQYQLNGKMNEPKHLFKIYNLHIDNVEPKPFYEFTADCMALNTGDNVVAKSLSNEYISETGQVHVIADVFEKYKRRVLKNSIEKMTFTGHEDTDVIVNVQKNGQDYTIDIYTGEDARKFIEKTTE